MIKVKTEFHFFSLVILSVSALWSFWFSHTFLQSRKKRQNAGISLNLNSLNQVVNFFVNYKLFLSTIANTVLINFKPYQQITVVISNFSYIKKLCRKEGRSLLCFPSQWQARREVVGLDFCASPLPTAQNADLKSRWELGLARGDVVLTTVSRGIWWEWLNLNIRHSVYLPVSATVETWNIWRRVLRSECIRWM